MSRKNEVEGAIDTEVERDFVIDRLRNLGRIKNFDQSVTATYSVPLDKLPLTDWISADVRYGANYTWQAGPFDPNTIEGINPVDTVGNTIQNKPRPQPDRKGRYAGVIQ